MAKHVRSTLRGLDKATVLKRGGLLMWTWWPTGKQTYIITSLGNSIETLCPRVDVVHPVRCSGRSPVRRPPEPDMQSGGSACGEHGATVKKAGRHGITRMRDGNVFTRAYLSCSTRCVSWCAFARVYQIKRTSAVQDENWTLLIVAVDP